MGNNVDFHTYINHLSTSERSRFRSEKVGRKDVSGVQVRASVIIGPFLVLLHPAQEGGTGGMDVTGPVSAVMEGKGTFQQDASMSFSDFPAGR